MDTGLDFMQYLEAEELDSVKMLLVYILMKNTVMEAEDIYSLIFHEGDQITWH